MAPNLSPLRAQLGASLCNRLAALSVTTPAAAVQVQNKSKVRSRKKKLPAPFAPGHGERIYIQNHIRAGMTIYAFKPSIPTTRALKQIPFNGKKLKPAKLRKDYWRTLAMVEFGQGQELTGQSVFQRLVECKRLHETDWSDDLFYEEETHKPLTRHERGARLNDQKANTVADLAAVLGGLGKGNRMLIEQAQQQQPDGSAAAGEGGEPALRPATVWWADELDRNHAQSWTANVEHRLIEDRPEELLTSEPEEGSKAAAEANP